MARIEHSKYLWYPDGIATFAVPVDEVELPKRIESELPKGTKFIEHTVYLGRQRGAGARKFWESQAPTSQSAGEKVSHTQYQEELEELNVPLAPSDTLWQPVKTLWVERYQMIADVEVHGDGANDQARVTAIAGNKSTDSSNYEIVKSGNAYSDRMHRLGFPLTAFHYLREDTEVFNYRTDNAANRLLNPAILPLTKAVQKVANPLQTLAFKVIPSGQFINRIRTNRETRRI